MLKALPHIGRRQRRRTTVTEHDARAQAPRRRGSHSSPGKRIRRRGTTTAPIRCRWSSRAGTMERQPLRGAKRGRFTALSTAATKGGAASGTAVTARPPGVGTACQQVLQRPGEQTRSEGDENRRSFLTTPRTGIRTAVPSGTTRANKQSGQIAGEQSRFVHSLREMYDDLRTGTYQRIPLINVRSRPPLTLRPWNSGCKRKGHKQTWQHVSCGPSLRSASPLRFEDVLVGIADGFVPVAGAPSPRWARHAHSLRPEKMSHCARRPVSTGGRPAGAPMKSGATTAEPAVDGSKPAELAREETGVGEVLWPPVQFIRLRSATTRFRSSRGMRTPLS